MKNTFIIFSFLLSGFSSAQNGIDLIKKADSFFNQNVSKGRINYNNIKTNPTPLQELISIIETTNTESNSLEFNKAYLINAYNVMVIKSLAEKYPIASPMDITGFFDTKKHLVGGKLITLNYLENKILRPTYKDARLHFVLVCGAVGCPPITDFAYTPEKLDSQLDAQTKVALNNPSFIKVITSEKTVELSEIFKWYPEDFKLKHVDEIAFINEYRNEQIPADYKTKHYPYDWSINEIEKPFITNPEGDFTNYPLASGVSLQTYTAGSLLKKGQIDLTLFNTIYTETKTNWLGANYSGYRTTFASSLIQFAYGTSKNARINLGVDLNLKASATGSDSTYGALFNPLGFKNNDTMRAGVAYVAPKIKISPFKGNNNFSIQSTFIVSSAKNPEGYSNPDGTGNGNLYWIEWDRIVWWNQLFYSKSFANDKLQLFTELDLLFRFAKTEGQTSHLDLPASVFLSWFPTKKSTIYVMSQHVPRFVYNTGLPEITDWVIGSNYTQSGIGAKYQILPSVNLELLYTNFWRSINGGQGETFNIGVKYVH